MPLVVLATATALLALPVAVAIDIPDEDFTIQAPTGGERPTTLHGSTHFEGGDIEGASLTGVKPDMKIVASVTGAAAAAGVAEVYGQGVDETGIHPCFRVTLLTNKFGGVFAEAGVSPTEGPHVTVTPTSPATATLVLP